MRRRRAKETAAPSHDRWLVSYADFITLLFAFFTTLYAISRVDKTKADALVGSVRTALRSEGATVGSPTPAYVPGGQVPSEAPAAHDAPSQTPDPIDPIDELEKQASEIAALPELAGRVQVRRERGGVVMSLSEAGFFESGRAELQKGAQGALELFAREIAARDTDIVVEGHTDNVPVKSTRFRSNWELSTVRATFVVSIFLHLAGFAPARIGAAGYADNRPVASNDSKEGRARNRRVDVVLRPALAAKASSSPTPPAAKTASVRSP